MYPESLESKCKIEEEEAKQSPEIKQEQLEDEEEPEPVPLKRKSKKYLEESFSIRLFEKHPLGRNWLEFIREGNCKRWRSDEDFLRWVKIAMGYFSSLEPKQNCVSLNVNSAAHLLIGKLQLFPLEMQAQRLYFLTLKINRQMLIVTVKNLGGEVLQVQVTRPERKLMVLTTLRKKLHQRNMLIIKDDAMSEQVLQFFNIYNILGDFPYVYLSNWMQPFALYGEMAKDLVVTRESNLTCIIHQSVSVRVNKSVLNKYVHNLHSMEAEEQSILTQSTMVHVAHRCPEFDALLVNYFLQEEDGNHISELLQLFSETMAELEQRLELKKEYHLKHWCKSTAMEQKKLCVYCLVKKTNIACAGCEKIWGVEVALCADKCYNEYHEKVLLITAEEPEQLDYLVGIDWEINKICSLVIELEAKQAEIINKEESILKEEQNEQNKEISLYETFIDYLITRACSQLNIIAELKIDDSQY